MAHSELFPGEWQPQVVLMAALEVGLVEAVLDAPLTPAEAAARLGLDERATVRVAEVLADAGYLERVGEAVQVAPDVRPFLDPDSETYAGDRLLHVHQLLGRWVQLPRVLREGGPAPSARTPESLRAFVGSMRAGARRRARPLVELLAALFPATSSVLDIGGGPGTLARAFRDQGWRVTVLDYPEVIQLTGDELAKAGIDVIGGDATHGIPVRGFDLVFCGNLFHSMSHEEASDVVAAAADALDDGGALAIFDFLRGDGLPSSLFAVNMLVATTAGDAYGQRDYRRWCEAAGLREFAVHQVGDLPQRLLTAIKR